MSTEEFKRTIASIELINFMCHSHLIVNLNKPLTVIAGRNGSGKSAIMIAIGLALGQRAQHLERGNSFKELIKSKESVAVVRVVLNNHKGFKKSFFGDTIIVERRICVKSSTITIMNGGRKVWSMKREDLELMLDFFSLRLENPLNFLTQEQAKRFLNLARPEMLYELFMKGTEIAETCQLNEESMRNVKAMTEKIDGITEELEVVDKRILEEKDNLSIIGNIKMMEEELRQMEEEILWAKLEEKRIRMEESFGRFKAKQDELDEHNRRTHEMAQLTDELREEIRSIENEEAERKRSGERRREEIEVETNKLEMRHREINNDIKELKETKSFKDKIILDFERQNGLVKDLRPQLEVRCKELSAETKALTERLNVLAIENDEYEKKKNVEDEMNAENETKIFQLKKHIEFYSKNDQNAFLNPNLPKIMNEISRTRFVGKVIGPIAFKIKLREQKWSKVASIVLNNSLTTFIVLDRADKATLLKIFKSFHVDFSVSMPSSKIPKAISYKANSEYKTLLSVLDIGDTFVLNHLIITSSIEQIILVESREEAYRIIRTNPALVDSAYTTSGDRVKLVGGSLSDFVTRGVDKFYFENTQQRLEMCKLELKRLQERRIERTAENKLREIKDEMRRISESIESNKRASGALELEIENARQMYETQLEIVYSEGLYEEVKNLAHQIELLERKQEEIADKTGLLVKEMEGIKNSKARDTTKLRLEISQYGQEIKAVKRRIDTCQLDLLELKGEHQRLMESYNLEKANLLESGKKEILASRMESEVREKMVQVRAQIEMSKDVRNEKEMLKVLKHLENLKKRKESLIAEYKDKIANSLEDVKLRILKRDFVRNEIADRATKEFSEITGRRGYEGSLEFNHEAQMLNLRMKVHGYKDGGSKSTLSGGERSFAGVSLLLSLWPSLCCPVKILDEFDVFMDNLNRKQIIRLFLEFFRKRNFQAILITPLNTEDLFEEFCDVIILDKPQRGS